MSVLVSMTKSNTNSLPVDSLETNKMKDNPNKNILVCKQRSRKTKSNTALLVYSSFKKIIMSKIFQGEQKGMLRLACGSNAPMPPSSAPCLEIRCVNFTTFRNPKIIIQRGFKKFLQIFCKVLENST